MTSSSPTRSEHSPVIVALEGLCYSGKSTLIRHLAARLDAIVAPEYTDLAPLPPWPPADHTQVDSALRQLLDLEQLRTRQVHRRIATRTHPPHVVLLDRSPLTLIAHEFGMQALGIPADPDSAATLFAGAASAGQILTPTAYLYLAVPELVTAARRVARGPVAAHLVDPAVRTRIDQICRTWMRLLPHRRQVILDGTVPPPLLAAAVTAFLGNLAGPPVPSWRCLTAHASVEAEARS